MLRRRNVECSITLHYYTYMLTRSVGIMQRTLTGTVCTHAVEYLVQAHIRDRTVYLRECLETGKSRYWSTT